MYHVKLDRYSIWLTFNFLSIDCHSIQYCVINEIKKFDFRNVLNQIYYLLNEY